VNQVIKPFVGSSALAGPVQAEKQEKQKEQGNLTAMIDISSTVVEETKEPRKQPMTPKKRSVNLNESLGDSISRGGGIASKIGLAMSRIVQSGQNERLEDDEEIRDLINLIEDLNSHSDLTEKLTNQSKISLFLQKAGGSN
jgi:hypothetical protein